MPITPTRSGSGMPCSRTAGSNPCLECPKTVLRNGHSAVPSNGARCFGMSPSELRFSNFTIEPKRVRGRLTNKNAYEGVYAIDRAVFRL